MYIFHDKEENFTYETYYIGLICQKKLKSITIESLKRKGQRSSILWVAKLENTSLECLSSDDII